jgi:uncharacterized protein (TIGR00725 family)
MAGVAAGVRARGGTVIGVAPGPDRSAAAANLSAVIVTNMGQARNAIIVWSADALIAVGGSWGTLSEVALAMRRGGIPVVSLGGWQVADGSGGPEPTVLSAATPEEAVALALPRRSPRDPAAP